MSDGGLLIAPAQSGLDTTAGQVSFAVLLVLLAGILAAILLVKRADHGLTDRQLTVRDQVRAGLEESAKTVRFSAERVRTGETSREDMTATLVEAGRGNVDAPETTSEAASEIRDAIGAAWADATEAIPKRALQLGEWALLVVVFGSIAIATGAVVSLLSWQADRMDLRTFLAAVASAGSEAAAVAVVVAARFPFADIITEVLVSLVAIGAVLVYQYPWVLAGVMVVLAMVLIVFERLTGHVPRLSLSRRSVLAGVVVTVPAMWAVGTGGGIIFRPLTDAYGRPDLAPVIGLLLALAVGLIATGLALIRLRPRINTIVTRGGAGRGAVVGILGGRLLAGLLRLVAIAAVVVYVAVGLTSGRLERVIVAAQTAALEVQLALVGIALFTIGLVLWEIRAAAPRIRRAIVELQARQRARISVALSVAPYAGVVFAYIATWAWRLPVELGLFLSVLAGVLFYGIVGVYRRARRRHAEREKDIVPRGSMVVSLRRVETVAGPRFIARIGGTLYAHESLEAVAEMAAEVVHERAVTGEASPRVEEWFARHLRVFGLAAYEDTYNEADVSGKLPERARKQILTALREADEGKVHRETLIEEHCEELPDHVVRKRLSRMVLSEGCRMFANGMVHLKKDIWAEMTEEASSRPRGATGAV